MTELASTLAQSFFTANIEAVEGQCVILSVPDNAYRIRLDWQGNSAPTTGRVKGTIRVHALRVHSAASGGRFIEPLMGAPRIVAGRVESIDQESATIALRSVVPMRVALECREDLAACSVGELVHFHVRSAGVFVSEPST